MKNEDLGKKGYKKYENRANEYLNDEQKASELLKSARQKAGQTQRVSPENLGHGTADI